MGKNLTLVILLFFQLLKAFGQTNDLSSSNIEIDKWFDSLKIQALPIQLKMISEKFRSGSTTESYYCQNNSTSIKEKVVNSKNDTLFSGITCRETTTLKSYTTRGPILIINPKLFITITDKTDKTKISQLCDLLSPQNIESLKILEPNVSTVLFGGIRAEGALILNLSNKKLLKKFKQLNLENYN